jgi:hypothetical protein
LVLERRTRMSAYKIGPFLVAVVMLLVGITLGDWDRYQGFSGFTPLAIAQDAMGRDDDQGNNKKQDHFACYEVKCLKKGRDKGGDTVVDCPKEFEKVVLFNQFTEDDRNHRRGGRDDDGLTVVVERLKLLCVPTRKEHDDHRD